MNTLSLAHYTSSLIMKTESKQGQLLNKQVRSSIEQVIPSQ